MVLTPAATVVAVATRPAEEARRGARRPDGSAWHRDDLQGLRAVAVLLVVLGHAGVGFLPGGFVGVDVFFVLSGFLITRLLLSEAGKRGSVSLGGFYVRRARRILPAAALTLVTTAVASYHLLNFVRAKEVVWDCLSASVFAANVHFANQGTDYFERDQPPSPVQHFWSLAVEEQFYLVWPALLSALLFGLAFRRRPRRGGRGVSARATRRLLIAVCLIAVVSLAWSIHSTAMSPAAAYFSTFARAWELALGAALAIAASGVGGVPAASTRGRRLAQMAAGWVGLVAIACAGVFYSAATPFPGYAALLPTLGAALVIAAGLDGQGSGVGRLLATAPLRYVGDRSYTLYLWHWPVLIIAVEYAGHELSVGVNLLLIVGAFLLSIVTYRVYENPIRRSGWSAPASALLWPASVAAMVVVAAFVLEPIYTEDLRLATPVAAVSGNPAENRAAKRADARRAVAASRAGRTLPAVAASVRAARRGERIPSGLTPPVGRLRDPENLYFFPEGCTPEKDSDVTSEVCSLGDTSARRSIVVLGDSHAQMWMPAILHMAERDGWVVRPIVKSACTPIDWSPGSGSAACHAWYRWAIRQVAAMRPDVALVTGSYGDASASDGSATRVKSAFISLAAALKRSSDHVVLIGDDPGVAREPVDCLLARNATMSSCTTTWPAERFEVNGSLSELAPAQGYGFIDTTGWFCLERACPTVIGHAIAYRDTNHISNAYALELAEPFAAAFRRSIRRPA